MAGAASAIDAKLWSACDYKTRRLRRRQQQQQQQQQQRATCSPSLSSVSSASSMRQPPASAAFLVWTLQNLPAGEVERRGHVE